MARLQREEDNLRMSGGNGAQDKSNFSPEKKVRVIKGKNKNKIGVIEKFIHSRGRWRLKLNSGKKIVCFEHEMKILDSPSEDLEDQWQRLDLEEQLNKEKQEEELMKNKKTYTWRCLECGHENTSIGRTDEDSAERCEESGK